MDIDVIGLAGAFSYALDCIEAELVHISNKHGKRVAYMSVNMAKKMNIKQEALQDLAMCALLHDNALTQYIYEEFQNDLTKNQPKELNAKQIGIHCLYGEENIKLLPFHNDIKNVILYHHENADGTGPFGKNYQEVPLFSRIIHLCDIVDSVCERKESTNDEKWQFIQNFLNQQRNLLFDYQCVDAFLEAFSKEEFIKIRSNQFEEELWKSIPRNKYSCNQKVCQNIVEFFTKIIDYKSEFTSRHSLGVAQKVEKLAKIMNYKEEDVQKIYLAGAFHDIGKMAVGNDILEKPARLTDEEYDKMKNHAGYTYLILSEVHDFEEIRDWAAFHHEKLDGSGYPFGKTGKDLNEPERMMACIDIYQALTEPRPYKEGMSHEKACQIMEDMVKKGQIDGRITKIIQESFQ